jgi:hypothetical protein
MPPFAFACGGRIVVDLEPWFGSARRRMGAIMTSGGIAALLGVATALAVPATASAQATAPTIERAPAATANTSLDALKGVWIRPDGGYTITIRNIGPNGQLEAMYFNPNQLPFARAQARQDGSTVRASFELQAGGYAGSTYELTYDATTDRLNGVYYQAVAKQKFDVYFVRKPR